MTSSAPPPSTLTIASRYAGPPRSGNGGYTAGRLAAYLIGTPDPVTVTLRSPPPLETAMRVEVEPGLARLRWLDTVVAEASPGAFTDEPVAPVDAEAARAAESAYQGLAAHPFPSCFVCGTIGDGLRLKPGLLAPGRTACLWTPDASLAGAGHSEAVAAEFVWSALDCPGGWTSDLLARPMVLGRMTAAAERRPHIGEPLVVVGGLVGAEARKTMTATTLYDAGGCAIARAEHTWVTVDPTSFTPDHRAERPRTQ